MRSIRIPEDRLEGLISISRLTEQAVDEICLVLDSAPFAIHQVDFIMQKLGEITNVSLSEAKEVVKIVLSLYPSLTYSGKSVDGFIKELVEALHEETNLDLTENEIICFNKNLKKLLSVQPISVVSKAIGVLYDCDNILQHARVLTDIRPVFGYGDDDSIMASVIVHTLRLHYVKDHEEKDIFVTVDNDDIDNLIAILQRAKKKALQSEKLLNEAKVRFISMENK